MNQELHNPVRDDEAGARKLEEMSEKNPEITAMVIRVACEYMRSKQLPE